MEKSIKNRKVKFEYEFIEVYTAGIKLTGLEVKAFRESKFNITDTYCYFHRGELFIKGAIIVGENVDLKLLLRKKELRFLEGELVKGLTIVPYKVYRNNEGFIKAEIVLARGKKLWDKRNSIKTRDLDRELKRNM